MHLDCGVCTLRPWRPGDEDALVRHADDRGIWLWLRDRFPSPYTRADAEYWIGLAGAQEPPTSCAIAVHDEVAGGIGILLHTDVERCAAEIGYWVGRAFWGKGLATAALRGFSAYALQAHALTRVYALPFADNAASIRVLEKAGFRCEGRLRRSAIKDGRVRDQALYALTDEDLQGQSGGVRS